MKTILITTLVMICMLCSVTCYSGTLTTLLPEPDTLQAPIPGKPVPHPDALIAKLTKKTVMLTRDDRPFCSGTLATDEYGITWIYTAAHCCDVFGAFTKNQAVTYTGKKIDLIRPTEVGGNYAKDGIDACRIAPVQKVTSPIKVGAAKTRDLMGVSAFPRYSPSERIVRLFVMGISFEGRGMIVCDGKVFPGMSGSPVIDQEGTLVGFMVAHYLNTPSPNNVLITILNDTGFLKEKVPNVD